MSFEAPSQQDLFSSKSKSDKAPTNTSSIKETPEAEEAVIDINLSTDKVKSALLENIDVSSLAPMLRQYVEIKREYEGYLLFFQVGDFFEVFFDDAPVVADALSIRLTSRDKDQLNPIPMCGVPIHAFQNYLPKLLSFGFSCVVVEQVEEASQAKGMVKREVTRIVTPGVRLEGEGLDEKKYNYLASVIPNGTEGGICTFIEVSTGVLLVSEVPTKNDIENILYRYSPMEVLLPFKDLKNGIIDNSEILNSAISYARNTNTKVSYRSFVFENIKSDSSLNLLRSFSIEDSLINEICETLNKRSPSSTSGLLSLLDYVKEVSLKTDLCISNYSFNIANEGFVLDVATRRNLELTEASFDGDKRYSVLGVIDKTKTAAGGRLLHDWMLSPLSDKSQIDNRLDAVEEIRSFDDFISPVRNLLAEVRDIERLSTRISGNRATPYDFGVLRTSLNVVPEIKKYLSKYSSNLLSKLNSELDALEDVKSLLDESLVENLPAKFGEQPIIKETYHTEIKHLRDLRKDTQGLLSKMELEEKSSSEIQNLKIKHNSVFGYFIEVSKGQLSKVPDRYVRKQTLTNVERFITPELKSLEQEIFTSKSRLYDLEKEIFTSIRKEVSKSSLRLQKLARQLAAIDVLYCFAYVSEKNSYLRPEITDEPKTTIEGGRHPIVEMVCGRPNFIPNDTSLNREEEYFAVLTGPNMGGKSTYLRQLGIIQVLAQIGCPVPVKKATIGIADRIFTRIGAGDAVSRGESTFMVEMKEAASILQNATERSLVLIDEIGRGTATADGLALATAISHWLIDKSRCRTVFATHFHELTFLPKYSPGVFCLSVGIIETRNKIEFTHRIEKKVSTKSYGLHVARLAGIPEELLEEAQQLLRKAKKSSLIVENSLQDIEEESNIMELPNNDTFKLPSAVIEVFERLQTIYPEQITPLEALQHIYDLSQKAKETELPD